MALALKDRVKETTTTTGTGTLTLVSAPSGFRRFNSVLSNGDTTYYCIESGSQWEVGIGTYSANTLARTTVLASSNANALINITASRSFVFITYAADKAVYRDGSNRAVIGDAGLIFSDNTVQTTAATTPDLSAYLTSATAASTYVPYTGATGAVNLGTNTLTCGAITASGNLLVNAAFTSLVPQSIIRGTGTIAAMRLQSSVTGSTNSDGFGVEISDANAYIWNYENAPIFFGTNNTTRLTIAADGAITASGLLSLQNSTTPMELNLHNTYTSATSREYLKMLAVTGGAYQIGSAIGSAGGSNRAIQIGHWNAAGSFTSNLSVNTTANQVQIGTIVAGYNVSYSTNIYGVNLNNATPHCTIWSGDGSAFGSSFSGYNVFMVGSDVGTLSGYGIGAYSKFVYSNGSTLSIPQICIGNPSGFSGLDLALGTTGTPSDGEYTVTSGYGTNKAGASLWLMAGRSTGSGAGGSVYIGTSNTGSSGATRNTNLTLAQFNSTAITFSRDLLFPDASYDIGKSGATRPRDGFFSRNVTIGGTATFAGAIVADGVAWTGKTFYQTGYSSVGWGLSAGNWYFGNGASDWKFGLHASSGVQIFSGTLGFNGNLAGSANDLEISRDAADILAQRRGTNAQTFRLAETWTSSTSFGVLQFKANAGAAYQIGSAIGSAGGTNRDLSFGQWNSAGTFSNLLNISGASGGSTVRIATTSGTGTCGLEFGSTLSGWQMGQIKVSYDSLGGWGTGYDFVINAGSGPSHLATLFSISSRGRFVFTQLADSGSPTAFTLTGAAHTTLTASTEATDVNFNLARTVQFATGALTTQRAMRIQAPTYSFVGASTITTASTLSISGAPTAGTNATITNAYALNVESGKTQFGGWTQVGGTDSWNTPLSVGHRVQMWASGYDCLIMNFGAGSQLDYHASWGVNGLQLQNRSAGFGWSSLSNNFTSFDAALYSPSAHIIEQRIGTNAQEFRIYTTYTSATSYERLEIKGKSGANFEIGAENGSAGGTLRGITIGGYSAGSSTITPWITLTNTGAATFASTITASDNITTNGLLSSDRYAVSANYRFRRANGTISSPTQVLSGQAVGALSSFGYHDGSAFHSSAGAIMYFVAAENFTSTAQGTNIQFWTTPTTSTTSAKRVTIEASGELTLEAGSHIQTSGAGIKIGTATSQKLGFWNATPVVQQTTASTSATVVGGGGTTVTQTDTFDGYTLAQIVKALRTIGILA